MLEEEKSAILRKLPKIELHAHLGGCVRLEHLQDLVEDKSELPSLPGTDASPLEYFEFMAAVGRISTKSTSNLQQIVLRVLEDFEADGVVHLELRSSPKHTDTMSKTLYIETILQSIRDYQGAMIVRYLISIDEAKSLTEMLENAELAVKYTSSSPLVVGVDLCGNYYSANLTNTLQVLKVCKDAGLKIACHIAEHAVISSHTSPLLRDIQPDRLGHATVISPHSEDGKLVRTRRTPIECCMTSNVLSRAVRTYEEHHFKTWRDLGHPVLLCTDDSGTFGTSLTREYEIAMEKFGLSVDDLRKMNLQAIDWIFDDTVRTDLLSVLKEGFTAA